MESDCLEMDMVADMFGQVDLGQHDGPGGCAPTRTSTAAALPDDSPAGLVARWAVLIAEYEAFQEALRVGVQQLHWPGVRQYISMLHAEARQTKRLAAGAFEDEPEKRRGEMRLAVTTLAAKEGMWRVIKTCRGVMALDRRFPKPLPSLTVAAAAAAGPPQEGTPERTKWVLASQQRRRRMYDVSADSGSRTEGMFVNAVVDNGRSWMRVLTTTNAQLLVEMAENGWEWRLAEGEDDEEQGDDALADISDMSLVILALGLIEAAHANCVRGAYPHIYILLTRMDETAEDDGTASQEEAEKKKQECAEIARYLGKVRRGLTARAARLPPDIDGCRLQIEIHSARDLRTTAQPPSDLQVALQRLLPDLSNRLTPTLNIDTSILITLTSDITNSSVEVRDWHPWQRVDEITREAKRPGGVLRSLMEDALCGRRLVCTREAAQAFRVMVYDMAQPSEQERARVLLGEGDKSGVDRQTLVNRYRELSAYPDAIPDDLMLPVVVETRPWGLDTIMSVSGLQSRDATPTLAQPPCPSPALPAVASTIANEMNDTHPTLSVFFYGWAMCYTTITTNLAARNRITRLLERHRTSSAEKDPLIWVCRTARSLNATNPRDGRKEARLIVLLFVLRPTATCESDRTQTRATACRSARDGEHDNTNGRNCAGTWTTRHLYWRMQGRSVELRGQVRHGSYLAMLCQNFARLIRWHILDRIVQFKQKRWMNSDEYALHRWIDIGTAPLYSDKTKALFRSELEDEVVINAKPTIAQLHLSQRIVVGSILAVGRISRGNLTFVV